MQRLEKEYGAKLATSSKWDREFYDKQPRSKELRFVTIYPTVTCYNQLGRLGSSHLEIPEWILFPDPVLSNPSTWAQVCSDPPVISHTHYQLVFGMLGMGILQTLPLHSGWWCISIHVMCSLFLFFILKFTKDQHVLAIFLCQWHFSLGACFGTWNVEIVPFGLIAATLSLESIWRPSCSFLFWLQKKQQPTAPFSFPHLLHLNSHANWATLATPWRMTCVLAIECWIPSFLQASCEEVAVGGFLLTLLSGEVPNCNQIPRATPLIALWPLARSNGAAKGEGGASSP